MKTKALIFSLASAGMVALLTSTTTPMKPIKQLLQDQVNGGHTPSIQYMFFDTDSILFEYHAGQKNVAAQEPVSLSTRYHLFSVTKTFTALAVLQLAQEGKVDLNRPVINYLPEFKYDRRITVEQLLSHTSGMPNPLPLRWIHLEQEHAAFNRNEFFDGIFQKNPKTDFEPGVKFKYSNLGYVVLGQLVERLSGMSLEEYISVNIIDRSGIDRSELNFTLDTSTHAVGYQRWLSFNNAIFGLLIDKPKFMGRKEGDWKPFVPFYNNGTAYGGLFGTGRSLVKYAQRLLDMNSALINDKYKDILFTEPVINGKPTGMAHSWFKGTLKGNRYFAHAGGGGGYYVELRVYPDLGVGSVVLFNRTGVSDQRFLDQADAAFISEKRIDQANYRTLVSTS